MEQRPANTDLWWPTRSDRKITASGVVLWAILPGRATQHAVQLEEDSSSIGRWTELAKFVCLSRSYAKVDLELQVDPWPVAEAAVCKMTWCQYHWKAHTVMTMAQRLTMRKALQKIAKDLAEHGELS